MLLLCPALALAAESIASIEHIDSRLVNATGSYEIEIYSIATLANITVNGIKISELSGLAWDEDENILYALSDNGQLLHLQPVIENNQLTDIRFLAGFTLQDNDNKPVKYKRSDSEGLATINSNNSIKGDTELIICFERVPRVVKYIPDGRRISEINLHESLSNIKNYRSENKSLEAITVHEVLGVLVAPENPLLDQDRSSISVYSTSGQRWSIPSYNPYNGALTGMTTMTDGSLLLLERALGGLIPSMEITLHRVVLDKEQAKSEIIYSFANNNDFFSENFEGITRFRDNQYLMISDDNNHPLRKTLLVYFSISEIK